MCSADLHLLFAHFLGMLVSFRHFSAPRYSLGLGPGADSDRRGRCWRQWRGPPATLRRPGLPEPTRHSTRTRYDERFNSTAATVWTKEAIEVYNPRTRYDECFNSTAGQRSVQACQGRLRRGARGARRPQRGAGPRPSRRSR